MQRLMLVILMGMCSFVVTDDKKESPARTALQPLNDFIGVWKGVGGPDKPRIDPRDPTWKETINWSWKFKGSDSWLTFDITDGKYLAKGDVRYLADKKHYQLTLTDVNKAQTEFTGKRDEKGYLTFERVDPATEKSEQIVMNSAAEGVRFVYRYATKEKGRTAYNRVYQVAASREGESLASAGKKVECIVTGGLGTIQVTYQGKTYYVCCTGCRDAFNDDPAKYVKEWESKKK